MPPFGVSPPVVELNAAVALATVGDLVAKEKAQQSLIKPKHPQPFPAINADSSTSPDNLKARL
jgi:hypothetical protein